MNIILFDRDEREFTKGDERYDHLRNVLHAKEGSTFRGGIINAERGECTVTSLTGEGVSFTFAPEKEDGNLFPLTVILAMVRPICMKRILRELVSLGVSRIILTTSELGEKSYRSSGLYTEGEYRKIMLSPVRCREGTRELPNAYLQEVSGRLFPWRILVFTCCLTTSSAR